MRRVDLHAVYHRHPRIHDDVRDDSVDPGPRRRFGFAYDLEAIQVDGNDPLEGSILPEFLERAS
jgi:hypothetical protein